MIAAAALEGGVPVRGRAEARTALKTWVRALEQTAPVARGQVPILPMLIERLAERFREAPALLSDGVSMSYQELANRTNAYAGWAVQQNLRPGDVVGLLMPNCPDYVAIWLGLSRVGVVVALINTNLVGESLVHAIRIASCRQVIVGAGLAGAFFAVRSRLAADMAGWAHGENAGGLPRIETAIPSGAGYLFRGLDCPIPDLMDLALYIYTSGTTGLPKAANVSHLRLLQWVHWFAGIMDVQASDRMYNCLPLYHSVGGVVAIGATLVGGGSVVIRRGFSASRFWQEVVAWECTLFQYIGELCRYLVESPPVPEETSHRLRLCCGNGLRPEVWERFGARFRIPHILEFYAATEGTFSLYNCEEEPGAIGRIPAFLAHCFPVALLRLDIETGQPVRDVEGRCIRCGPDEPGEAIGKISMSEVESVHRFEGYADREASERKILRDVFAGGDAWFRTGDVMRKDARGFFYFVDRVGDTFRWKGENVATSEVTAAIKGYTGVLDAVVYGVCVPGAEGRAGMAAVVPNREFDLVAYWKHVMRSLPKYARPLFLRICRSIPATATFKPQIGWFAREGFDPTAIDDPIYFSDYDNGMMTPLDEHLYRRIQSGETRL